jgi:hypothetical protein
MTTCFVFRADSLCLAAADTRISDNLDHQSLDVHDNADVRFVTPSGQEWIVPIRMRKIRQTGRGWGAMAGCVVTGERMLSVLSRERASSPEHVAEVLLRQTPTRMAELEALVGGDGSWLYSSILMGVSTVSEVAGVWCAELDRVSGYQLTFPAVFQMNWPLSIQEDEKAAARDQFFISVDTASCVEDVIRAAATLIGAARTSPDSSSIVQIGVTVQEGEDSFESRYLHGHVDEIVGMTNERLRAAWESLPI